MSDCFSYKKSPLSHCETNFVLLTEMFDKHYVLYYIFTTPGKDTTCSKWACQHKQPLCLKCLVFGMEMVQVCEQNEGMQPENREPLFLLKEVKLHLTKKCKHHPNYWSKMNDTQHRSSSQHTGASGLHKGWLAQTSWRP